MSENKSEAIIPGLSPRGCPLAITGTWEGARAWLSYARKFEECKLWSQVMLGFELLELHRKMNVKRGGDRRSVTAQIKPNNLGLNWEDTCRKEADLSDTAAGYVMKMAQAAAPRLRKMIGAKDLDLINTPISELPEVQRTLLSDAVKKITDGKTQMDFGIEFGVYKKPQGSGAKGRKPGEGGKRKLTLEEQAALMRQMAVEDWFSLDQGLAGYRVLFTVLPDEDVMAQMARLEQALVARRAWLKQSRTARDVKAIEELLPV